MTGKHGNKVVANVAEALAPLRDGMTIMVGGFGLSGNPEALIRGVVERGRPQPPREQRSMPLSAFRCRLAAIQGRHP